MTEKSAIKSKQKRHCEERSDVAIYCSPYSYCEQSTGILPPPLNSTMKVLHGELIRHGRTRVVSPFA